MQSRLVILLLCWLFSQRRRGPLCKSLQPYRSEVRNQQQEFLLVPLLFHPALKGCITGERLTHHSPTSGVPSGAHVAGTVMVLPQGQEHHQHWSIYAPCVTPAQVVTLLSCWKALDWTLRKSLIFYYFIALYYMRFSQVSKW